MQNGSIMRSERRRGPDVWEYRWREPGPDGKRKHRRIVVGTINQFADKQGRPSRPGDLAGSPSSIACEP
jgi:hypothetical protein